MCFFFKVQQVTPDLSVGQNKYFKSLLVSYFSTSLYRGANKAYFRSYFVLIIILSINLLIPKSLNKIRFVACMIPRCTGVNFINVKRANFSHKHCFCSFFQLCFGFGKKFVRKRRAYNVDEIDGRCQFYQHFIKSFQKCRSQKCKKMMT